MINSTTKLIEITFQPTYKKETGLWYLDIPDIPIPSDFKVVEKSIVCIPPKEQGGNHKHPRREAFVGIGEGLELAWLDENNDIHTRKMYTADHCILFIIPSFLPHVVSNNSTSEIGFLFEQADALQTNVEEVIVV